MGCVPIYLKIPVTDRARRINLSACKHAQAEGKASKMLEVVLEEKRREIIKEWIDSGRIENINSN